MRRTDSRTAASCTASEQDVVVFPTSSATDFYLGVLHLAHTDTSFTTWIRQLLVQMDGAGHPPQKIHFKLFWSSTFCSVGGSGSKSSDMMMEWFCLARESSCICMQPGGMSENELVQVVNTSTGHGNLGPR